MTRPLVLLVYAALTLLPQAAAAKPKVALTQIENDASGDVREAVVEALEGKELSLIGGKEVNRAVDKLGDLADLTEKDLKKLATELEADAIVIGKLDKVGGSKTLKFRLFVHKKLAKGFTVSFKDARSEKFRTLLHDKMIDKLGLAAGGDGDSDEDKPARKKKAEDDEDPLASKTDKKARKTGKKAKAEDEEEARPRKTKAGAKAEAEAEADEDARASKKAKAGAEDEDARAKKPHAEDEDARAKKPHGEDEEARPAPPAEDDARPAKRASADDEDAPRKPKKKVATSEDGEELEGGVAVTAEPAHAANRVAVRVDLGVSVLQRSLKFNTNIAGKPKNVSMSPVPGARLEAEIYPLAFSNPRSAAAGLGLAAEYDKTLKLNLSTNSMPGVAVPVKQSHYSIGVRYRLAFGKTETSPTLTLGVGYGKRLFSTDRSKLTDPTAQADIMRDTPETEYTVIDPGLSFRIPLTRMVAFSLGGRGMLITKAGPIQTGSSYGRAKVYGAEGLAAVDVVLGRRFALRFAGEFVQVGFQFTGVGALSNGLDGDTKTKDVGGLADRSIGGSATLAVLY
jgi:hypothetical protein